MTTQEIVNYYANLLILQYIGEPLAYKTIQALVSPALLPQVSTQNITFSGVSASGTFVLRFKGNNTASINWNDSLSTIQSKLQAVPGLSAVTVTGDISAQLLTVTFTGVPPVAPLLSVFSNSLSDGSNPVLISITETDIQLPLAVQNAFDLETAVGVQLDVLGKYAGVTRLGSGLDGTPIILGDADFRSFIKIAIVKNGFGSSLAAIQNFIHIYFPGALLVFDYSDMRMSYFLDSQIGSQQLAQIFVTSNILPVPMGVQIGSIIYSPDIFRLFGFRTYLLPAYNVTPFNNYASYNMSSPWLTYRDALVA